MRTLDCLSHLLLTVASLFQDTLRFIGAVLRSRSALMAENLFLRKQLVLYLERKVKPRRANDATRLTLVLLSRLFAWRQALTIDRRAIGVPPASRSPYFAGVSTMLR